VIAISARERHRQGIVAGVNDARIYNKMCIVKRQFRNFAVPFLRFLGVLARLLHRFAPKGGLILVLT
jgi:hypothetical protein